MYKVPKLLGPTSWESWNQVEKELKSLEENTSDILYFSIIGNQTQYVDSTIDIHYASTTCVRF